MASEEERRIILAEYKASAAADDDDDDDEADFDPSNHGDYDDDVSYQDDDSSDDDEGEGTATLDYAVLTGSIHLNDEGRVIYSGTWCYHSELEKNAGLLEKPTKKHPKFKFKSQAVCHPPPPPSSTDGNNGGSGIVSKGVLFDIHRPTLSKLPPAGNSNDNTTTTTSPTLPTRRTMIFDGFFFEPLPAGVSETTSLPPGKYSHGDGSPAKHHHHQHGKKIKERDVELFFTTTDNMDSGDKSNEGGNVESLNGPSSQQPGQPTAAAAVGYRISGRGHNDYGSFVLDGTYTPPPPPSPPKTTSEGNAIGETKEGSKHHHKHAKGPVATIVCNKTYGAGGSTKATRSGGASKGAVKGTVDEEDSGDDDFGDDKAEFGEVTELYEDATMTIEELKRKYYGVAVGEDDGGEEEEVGDGGGKVAATTISNKRPRLEESDDDECGF